MKKIYWLAATAIIWAASTTAMAQESTGSDWSVTVSPYVFGKSLKGKIQDGNLSSPVDVPLHESTKTLAGIFMGEVSVDSDRWGGYLNYQGTNNRDTLTLMGLPIKAKLHLNSLAGAAYYVAYEEEQGGMTVHGEPMKTRIRPLVGARWSRAWAEATTPNVISETRHVEWTDVIAGVRTEKDLSERWQLAGHFDMGGFNPGHRFSMNSYVHVNYRTHIASRPAILRAGYEVLFQEYKKTYESDDQFNWHITQHGPIVGMSITF